MTSKPGSDGAGRWTIDFEGRTLSAVPGETIAATLLAHGERQQSWARDGSPRGHYCGIGMCHDCLVTVDGEPSLRACMTRVRNGMRVSRQAYARAVTPGPEGRSSGPSRRQVDVLIVGAGPAGLSAATVLAEGGATVLVVDERPGLGGQYFKQAYGRAQARAPDRQARAGSALIEKAKQAGVSFESGAIAFGAERTAGGAISVAILAGETYFNVEPGYLIIATGAYERPTLVPGWTLPGVMTTGAAQTLVRSYKVSPGRRVLVAGNGPLNLQVACELIGLAEHIHVVDAAPPPSRRLLAALRMAGAGPALAAQGLKLIMRLHFHRIKIGWGHRLVEIQGTEQVTSAVVAPLGPNGEIMRDRQRTLDVDTVVTADGFLPSSELPRLLGCTGDLEHIDRDENGATSQRDVFVIGEAGGFGGAQVALCQGSLAGFEVLRRLGRRSPGEQKRLARRLQRARTFQDALWSLFAAPEAGLTCATPSTIICRCEAVHRHTLDTAIARHGISDVASLKRLTRAGMGRCQGRYCVPRLNSLLQSSDRSGLAPQIPLRPLPIAPIAVERGEWHGHHRLLPETSGVAVTPSLPVHETDTVVVGAGVAGLATAYFLAKEGRSVVVLDRGFPNSGASGGNAGSLHAQLLSFDHGEKASAARAAARTLPLQAESIRLWLQLQEDLGDLEMRITGGLMVAETERDMAFLEKKAATERDYGIDTRIVGRDELHALEPHVAEHLIGGAYCSQEGKINPLVATEALRIAAERAGAVVVPQAPVTGLLMEKAGFTVSTPAGQIRCGRVVNAAGAFAGRVARLLGADVPVHGAPLQMIVTEAVQPLVSCLLAFAGRHLTLKQAANGNIIIGGGWTAGLDPVHAHPRPILSSIEGNLWVARRVLPALSTVRIIRSWAAMNIDIDGAPIIGEHPSIPGFYNAVTANGYTLGPILGQLTADLIRTGRTSRDIDAFSLRRFPSLGQDSER